MKRYLLFSIVYFPMVVFASTMKTTQSEKNPVSPWDGSTAKFGAVINSGNTNTSTYNAGGVLDFTKNRWNNITVANWQFGRSDGSVNQEKYFAQDEVTYGLNEAVTKYLFLLTSLNVDKFSPYDYQFLIAAGYGWYLWKLKRFSLRFQFGPGYRRDKVDGTSVIHDQIVGTTRAILKWQITKNATFSQTVQYDIGSKYNYLKTVTAITNKITGNIAIQVSYVVDYYSRIPAGSSNTDKADTTMNVAVVYNF